MQWLIGDRVRYGVAYPRQTKDRFPRWDDRAKNSPYPDPKPLGDWKYKGEGCVVGIRSVIMSEYAYTPRRCEEDEGYSTGKRENVLLVAESIHQEPIIVRMQDAERMEQ
jgi:hypothetical protein